MLMLLVNALELVPYMMRYPERLLSDEPSVFRVGGVQLSVAEPFAVSLTAMENAGNVADALPSLTLIVTFAYEPTCALVGVPDRRPVDVLNVAQEGRF